MVQPSERENDLIEREVWRGPTPGELRRTTKIVRSHFIYTIKQDLSAKGRLVADGSYANEVGDTFSPTPESTSLRGVLVFAAAYT